MKTDKVTIHTLQKMKERGERITMLTAYDATFAKLLDESRIDILLVGDSLGMVIQGQDTTLPVTLDEIIYHTRAVARGTRRAQIVGDMPFMSYQQSIETAMQSAKSDCGACDVCLGQIECVENGTEITQKIVSCVLRLGQQYEARRRPSGR